MKLMTKRPILWAYRISPMLPIAGSREVKRFQIASLILSRSSCRNFKGIYEIQNCADDCSLIVNNPGDLVQDFNNS